MDKKTIKNLLLMVAAGVAVNLIIKKIEIKKAAA
jgi:hypothetical protein